MSLKDNNFVLKLFCTLNVFLHSYSFVSYWQIYSSQICTFYKAFDGATTLFSFDFIPKCIKPKGKGNENVCYNQEKGRKETLFCCFWMQETQFCLKCYKRQNGIALKLFISCHGFYFIDLIQNVLVQSAFRPAFFSVTPLIVEKYYYLPYSNEENPDTIHQKFKIVIWHIIPYKSW